MSRSRATITASLVTLMIAVAAPGQVAAAPSPAAAPQVSSQATTTTTSAAQSAVVNAARSHLGARFLMGATGPYAFDCSGLIYRSFVEANLLSRIGGSRRTAAGLYTWFRERGWASRTGGQIGDLVVYGYSGVVSHSGIYIGGGRVISALTSGVAIHYLNAVTKPFIAFLHTHLSTATSTSSTPAPAPVPAPTLSGSHMLTVDPGSHYTYFVSGSSVTSKRLLTITGSSSVRWYTSGIVDVRGLNGAMTSVVKLTSGPFAGRWMRPYEAGNHLR